MIIRGFTQGVSTNQLADELNKDYGTLLKRRHKIQQLALEHRLDEPLSFRRPTEEQIPDTQTEADELFQNAGEKGEEHPDPGDPSVSPRFKCEHCGGVCYLSKVATERSFVPGFNNKRPGYKSALVSAVLTL